MTTNAKTDDAEKLDAGTKKIISNDWKYWQPLVVITSAYSILAFLAGLQPNVMGVFFVAAALVFSITQLISIYAALGNGSYLKRLCYSQLCGAIFFFSLFGGLAISAPFPIGSEPLDQFLIAAVTASISSQFAFGIFRFFRGWRFHQEEAERDAVYSLQDLFVFTMFVAIVFAVLTFNDFANTDRIRLVLTSFSFFFFGSLIFGVPTLATTMRTREVENGCGVQLLILAIIAFVVTLPLLSIGAPIEVSGPVLLTLCGISLCSWLPVAILKRQGFVLTKSKNF